MLFKVFGANDWDYGQRSAELVKVSSRGLIGQDRKALEKRAGAAFVDEILKSGIKFAKDEFPVHLNAVGSTEGYGSNRNGDGFDEKTCEAQHHTFVKDAKVYKHHKNKEPEKSYGDVKLSHYNKDMRRIELLVSVNGSKEAAVRHGNLYDADLAERVNAGEDIPWSMACKVAYDVCSGCGNKAKTRAEYCDDDTCKYGGCKHNLTKVAFDGHVLHVNNPNCGYFDISEVIRPADRGAYGGLATYLQKAASGEVMGGAALAEMYGLYDRSPLTLGDDAARAEWYNRQIKAAHALAEADTQVRLAPSQVDISMSRAFHPSVQPAGLLESFQKSANTWNGTTWGTLAGKLCLPVVEFLSLSTGTPVEALQEKAAQVEAALPGVYGRLLVDADFETMIYDSPYIPVHGIPAGFMTTVKWAGQHSDAYSIDQSAVHNRAALAAVRGIGPQQMTKSAAVVKVSEAAEQLARQYALYKIACVAVTTSSRNNEVQLTSRLAVLQNCVQCR